MVHVSTAYVAGKRTALIREDELDCGQGFWNSYEKSKFDAEVLLTDQEIDWILDQGVMALAPVIEELQRQDYSFLSFENGQFVKLAAPPAAQRSGEAEAAPGTSG